MVPTADDAAHPAPHARCGNCGAELCGPYCHVCGQPIKGAIRPLASLLHDMADTLLNLDSRIFRTLLPLLLRPGFLTNEYFAGRRVRYVTPFRLYFFLSVASFLLVQINLDTTPDLTRSVLVVRDDSRHRSEAERAAEGSGPRPAADGEQHHLPGAEPPGGESSPAIPAEPPPRVHFQFGTKDWDWDP
jgi:hypothetical protein